MRSACSAATGATDRTIRRLLFSSGVNRLTDEKRRRVRRHILLRREIELSGDVVTAFDIYYET